MLAVALVSQGCATGTPTAGIDVNFTVDGVAYRTFIAPLEQMQRATLTTLSAWTSAQERRAQGRRLSRDGRRAGDRTIYVELEKLTARTTRMRIIAKQGWVWRDRATAGEFIVQTERALGDSPAVTQRAK